MVQRRKSYLVPQQLLQKKSKRLMIRILIKMRTDPHVASVLNSVFEKPATYLVSAHLQQVLRDLLVPADDGLVQSCVVLGLLAARIDVRAAAHKLLHTLNK